MLNARHVIGLSLAVFLGTVPLGCGKAPDAEREIRQWLARGEAAVAAEDRRELMTMVAPAYADARGNGRKQIEHMLWLLFLRQDNVKVLTRIEAIDVYGESAADVRLTSGLVGSGESRLGFSAEARRFELELEHDGEDWQLIAAHWTELGEALH